MTEQDFPDLPPAERHDALVAYLEFLIREAIAEALEHISADEARAIFERELADATE
jgi:hypothetical protein